MFKIITLTLLQIFLLYPDKITAQTIEENEVIKTINVLFQAMEASDSAKAAELFHSKALLHTIYKKTSDLYDKKSTPIESLLTAFASDKKESWTEPIWNEKIQITNGFAHVWVEYAFYIGNTFSHCGIDAFHLIETVQGWKILSITDTRRTDECNVPDRIKSRYE